MAQAFRMWLSFLTDTCWIWSHWAVLLNLSLRPCFRQVCTNILIKMMQKFFIQSLFYLVHCVQFICVFVKRVDVASCFPLFGSLGVQHIWRYLPQHIITVCGPQLFSQSLSDNVTWSILYISILSFVAILMTS